MQQFLAQDKYVGDGTWHRHFWKTKMTGS